MCLTTLGWHVCCQWKDGSTSWEKLTDVKESHPLQMPEFATSMGVDHVLGFNWWVPHTLKKRDAINALVKKRRAIMWADAIAKEMKNKKEHSHQLDTNLSDVI